MLRPAFIFHVETTTLDRRISSRKLIRLSLTFIIDSYCGLRHHLRMPSQAASRRSSSHQTASTSQHAIGDDSSAVAASLAEDPKYAIATAFLSTMLHEVVIDTALLVHAQVKRQQRAEGKAPGGCPVCKTR